MIQRFKSLLSNKKFNLAGLISIILFFPVQITYAHVKWFIDPNIIRTSHTSPSLVNFSNQAFVIWLIIIVLATIVTGVIDHFFPIFKLDFFKSRRLSKDLILRIFKFLIGVFLVVISLQWNIILTPEFPVNSAFNEFLRLIEAICGFLFIANFAPLLAGFMLLFLYAMLGIFVDITALFENLPLVGVFLIILFEFIDKKRNSNFLETWGISLLRVSTGFALIVLAFTEKLLDPDLSYAFLQQHSWNFMHSFGFSNQLFVLSVGCAEILFGLIFLTGFITRVNTLAIAFFFAFSVVTMFVTTGKWEVEDMTVYASALLFLYFGSGAKLHLQKWLEHRPRLR